jgi:hypothetical protein
MRALEKEPARRYQRASEILTQVETLSPPATAAVRTRKMAAVYLVGMVCALAGAAVLGYELYHRISTPSKATIVTNTVANPPPMPGRGNRSFGFDYFTNTPDGPSLGHRLVTQLSLSPDQVLVVNAIIHANSQEFARIQSNYVAQTRDPAGHVHLTEKPLSGQDVLLVRNLRDQLWKELAGVLNTNQLDRARNLPSDPLDMRLFPINTNQSTSRELWRDRDGQYHYIEDLESLRSGETNLTTVSTNINIIPLRYRRYLDAD